MPNSSELEAIELQARKKHNFASRHLTLREARIRAIRDHYRKLRISDLPTRIVESVCEMLED